MTDRRTDGSRPRFQDLDKETDRRVLIWVSGPRFRDLDGQTSELIYMIGINAHLEKKLEQFERAFERDEIVDF
jgi:hypothetical protein